MSLASGMYLPVEEKGFWVGNGYVVGDNPRTSVIVAEIYENDNGWWTLYWFGFVSSSKGLGIGTFPNKGSAQRHVEFLVGHWTVVSP